MYAEFLENRRSPLHGQLSARRVEYKHHRSVKSRARCEAAGRVNRGVKRTIAAAGRQRGARQLRRSGSSLAIGEAASQSLALTECTHARARHTATRTRARRNARIVRHARSTARHPPAPPTIAPRCIMASMPATTLATADKMTQRSTIGASSRSSPQPRAPHASSGMQMWLTGASQ